MPGRLTRGESCQWYVSQNIPIYLLLGLVVIVVIAVVVVIVIGPRPEETSIMLIHKLTDWPTQKDQFADTATTSPQ